MRDLPQPPDGITLVSYADDCTLLATGLNIGRLCDDLNNYLTTLNTWFRYKGLKLSEPKSSATLFTSWTREVADWQHADSPNNISIDGVHIPKAANPKILGVVFDQMLTFNAHARHVVSRMKTRNNALKSLAGTNWGKSKETINTTYKSICRPLVNYAAPIWSPQLAESNWRKIQTCQNSALRTMTGCHLMSDQDHLHAESKILPVMSHNTLLSQQYLLACHQQGHPCGELTSRPPPPRNIRKTVMAHQEEIAHLTNSPPLSPPTFKAGLRTLHTAAVQSAITNSRPNKVLGTPPPEISEEERKLPRGTRTTLAQLRSGYSIMLKSYQHRLNPDLDNICPECGTGPHNTLHLFNCTGRPTQLNVEDLWTRPTEAADFLGLELR